MIVPSAQSYDEAFQSNAERMGNIKGDIMSRKKTYKTEAEARAAFWEDQRRQMNKLRKMGAYSSKHPIKKRRKGENINAWMKRTRKYHGW